MSDKDKLRNVLEMLTDIYGGAVVEDTNCNFLKAFGRTFHFDPETNELLEVVG